MSSREMPCMKNSIMLDMESSQNMTMTEKTRGGARAGAGRKPLPKDEKRVQMVITVDRETRDKLKARAKEQHLRVGRVIDNLFSQEK